MYIDGVTAPLPAARTRPRRIPARLLLTAAALLVAGCDLFDGGKGPPVVARPTTLTPEADVFRDADLRRYTWFEELRRDGKPDSLLGLGSFEITWTRDTVMEGEPKPFFDVSSSFTAATPAPTAFLTRLGLRADRVQVDPLLVPDPGPSYRFPETPVLGWRLDTTAHGLRFVRQLNRTETITQSGMRHQTWAFAESTWWAETPAVLLGSGTTWMGRTGLVRHQSLWPGFVTTAGMGTLVRTLVAP